jgi:hypothetical protein
MFTVRVWRCRLENSAAGTELSVTKGHRHGTLAGLKYAAPHHSGYRTIIQGGSDLDDDHCSVAD